MKTPRTRQQFYITLLVSLLFLAAAIAVPAQGPGSQQTGPAGQSLKGVVLKNKAPVNKEILKVKLPKAQETKLSNGLQVVLLEDHKVPTFSMQMVVLSGGLSDPPDHRGLAQFTGALLREGTAKRTSREISEQADSLGITLGGGSGLSSFTSTVSVSGLVENLDEAMDLFADVVRSPKFPQDEVERYKNRTLSQLQFVRSNPQFLAQERFNRAVYGDHPAGLVIVTADSVRKTTMEALARFHSTYYRPNNAILAIVGDVTLQEMLPKIERAFGSWERADVPATAIPPAPAQAAAKIYLVNRPGSVQTVLQLGTLGIERTDPDYFAVLVADRIFGGGPSGRLFMNLREEKGYTYGAYSSFSSSKYRGIWGASSEVRTDVTDGAMHEFMYELKRLREEKVLPVELENAKRAMIGSFALSLEQPASLLQNIITQKLYNLPADYWDTYPQKVSAITAEDVQRVAQKYLDLSRLQVVAVGDAAKVREVLSKYGQVEVYSAEGKPIAPGSEEEVATRRQAGRFALVAVFIASPRERARECSPG